jgi:hypothetical protein
MHKNFFLTLESCRGKYTAICEGDDFWIHPQKLAIQIHFLEVNPPVAGSFHDCFVLHQSSGRKELRVGSKPIDRTPNVASIIGENNIATCSMVFRNVIPICEIEEWLGRTRKSDFMLALLVAQRGPWHYIDDPMSVYRVHDGGIWSGAHEVERYGHNIQFWEMLDNFSAYASVADVIGAKKRNDIRGLSIALARGGKLWQSFKHYLRSLGPKHALHGRYFRSSKYFKEFARCLIARSRMLKLADSIRRKVSGPNMKTL